MHPILKCIQFSLITWAVFFINSQRRKLSCKFLASLSFPRALDMANKVSIWREGLGWLAHDCQKFMAFSKLSGSGKNWALAPHTSLKKDWLQSKDAVHSLTTTSHTAGSAAFLKLKNSMTTFPNPGCPTFSKVLTKLSLFKCCRTLSSNLKAISGPSANKDPNSEGKDSCHSLNDLPWMFVLTIRSIMDTVAAASLWHKLVAAQNAGHIELFAVWKLCFW